MLELDLFGDRPATSLCWNWNMHFRSPSGRLCFYILSLIVLETVIIIVMYVIRNAIMALAWDFYLHDVNKVFLVRDIV